MQGRGEREAVKERRGFVDWQRHACCGCAQQCGWWCGAMRRKAKGERRESYRGEGEAEGEEGVVCLR